jgi:hypothetical protein
MIHPISTTIGQLQQIKVITIMDQTVDICSFCHFSGHSCQFDITQLYQVLDIVLNFLYTSVSNADIRALLAAHSVTVGEMEN